MKKTGSVLAAVLLLLSLTGCSRYSSHYRAVGFVHSNETKQAFMSFYSFDGRMVFRLKSEGEGDLRYLGKLESGSLTVSYDYGGRKEPLFSLGGGDSADDHGGYVEAGPVYIIVETEGKCMNGELRFDFGA